MATVFGCPAGDALVMGSTNVLASAVAGCLLFGEAFGKWKVAAVLATVAGAVLVAKPERLSMRTAVAHIPDLPLRISMLQYYG